MKESMTIRQFVEAVRAQNTIFGVTFIKKGDGSLRTMNARMHVTKGVKGVLAPGQRREEDARNNVLTVYDMNVVESTGSTKGAFRRINLEQLKSCSLSGTHFQFDQDSGMLVS
jgi:hypothetical protein